MAAPDQRRDGVTHYSYGEGEGPQKIGPEGLDRSSEGEELEELKEEGLRF